MEEPAGRVELQAFSSRELRGALGAFATGVTVITTQAAGELYGMTANAFSSVSLDPPLVLICVISETTGSNFIEAAGLFAVNVLNHDQEPLSRYFSNRDRPRGAASFADIPHKTVTTGAPIIDGCGAYLDCRVQAVQPAGDHVIFIGEVRAIGHDPTARPLLFHNGAYALLDGG